MKHLKKTRKAQTEGINHRKESKFINKFSSFNIGSQTAKNIINVDGDFTNYNPGHIKIHFEDRGQDFLTWLVKVETGEVLYSQPYQSHIWSGKYVSEPGDLKPGDKVHFSDTPIDPTNLEQEFRTINYPVKSIEKL